MAQVAVSMEVTLIMDIHEAKALKKLLGGLTGAMEEKAGLDEEERGQVGGCYAAIRSAMKNAGAE